MSDNAPSYGIILSNRGPILDYCTPSDLIDLGVSVFGNNDSNITTVAGSCITSSDQIMKGEIKNKFKIIYEMND